MFRWTLSFMLFSFCIIIISSKLALIISISLMIISYKLLIWHSYPCSGEPGPSCHSAFVISFCMIIICVILLHVNHMYNHTQQASGEPVVHVIQLSNENLFAFFAFGQFPASCTCSGIELLTISFQLQSYLYELTHTRGMHLWVSGALSMCKCVKYIALLWL